MLDAESQSFSRWSESHDSAWRRRPATTLHQKFVCLVNNNLIMSAFVKCKINGPQMHYIVALAWKVFISCAHVWTKQEDRLKAAGWLFQMAAAETVKFLAPMVVLDHRTNYSFMVSADCRCCRPAASEAGTQSFSGFIVTSVCLGGVYAIRSVCLPFCLCAELLQRK